MADNLKKNGTGTTEGDGIVKKDTFVVALIVMFAVLFALVTLVLWLRSPDDGDMQYVLPASGEYESINQDDRSDDVTYPDFAFSVGENNNGDAVGYVKGTLQIPRTSKNWRINGQEATCRGGLSGHCYDMEVRRGRQVWSYWCGFNLVRNTSGKTFWQARCLAEAFDGEARELLIMTERQR